LKSYPLNETILTLERHIRQRSKNALNLRSCELIHPGLADIFASVGPIDPSNIQFYPYPEETIERIAQKWQIPADTMTLSAGSDPIIAIIIDALGITTRRMILQVPNYFGWQNYPTLRGITVTTVPFGQPKQHTFCLDTLIDNIRSNPPSIVAISNPNNPTGFVFSPEEIIILADECGNHGHLLIIDECFAGFANLNHYKIIGPREHVIFVRSFSKYFGLAGVRIALTIASSKITQYLSRWRPEAAVSAPALQMLEALINREAELHNLCKDIIFSREKFIVAMKEIQPDWYPLPSGANYVTFFLSNGDSPALVTEYLYQKGYHIRDVSTLPGLKACIRFGIAHWDIMQNVIEALEDITEDLLEASEKY
jgi:histidinol-phosphate/aromatic aminotransferase/cobyric acid decarboxylase-like protein